MGMPEMWAAATTGGPARQHGRRAAGGAQPEPGYDATRTQRGRATRPSGAAHRRGSRRRRLGAGAAAPWTGTERRTRRRIGRSSSGRAGGAEPERLDGPRGRRRSREREAAA